MTQVSDDSKNYDSHVRAWDIENSYLDRIHSIYADASWYLWKAKK